MIVTAHAHARAGLVGNPSDGYFGKTISFIIRNFAATVRLWESPHFEILPTHGDLARFASVDAFFKDVKLHGYYGGMRLIKATLKRFHDYARAHGIELHDRNFTIGFESDIPRLVGLAGSSAIIVATLRALTRFYEVEIPKHYLPTLTLAIEREELGISAGLQDRVIQVYEGIVYMDFEKSLIESRGYGKYEELRPEKMPPLYVAFDPARAEVSDVPHRNLRELYNRGDKTVVDAMRRYRELTDEGRAALMSGDWPVLGKSRRRELRTAADDHEHRAGKYADGGSRAIGRRQRPLLRQRRRDLRTVRRRQAIPSPQRRAGRDPVQRDAAVDLRAVNPLPFRQSCNTPPSDVPV
jgi:glucuronokinase